MRIRNVAIAGALMLTVAACGDDKAVEVSGARDDVKTVKAVKEISHKEKKTKRVCSSKKSGKCKSYRTVDDGYKKVVDKAGKPARWCVELDDVNGDADKDDAWYATSREVYLKAKSMDEGEPIKFAPVNNNCR